MKDFVWAINTNGELTKCTAKKENRGKGRCNHLLHADEGEDQKNLFERYMKFKNVLPLVTDEFRKYDYIKVNGFDNEFPPLLRKPKDENFVTNAQAYNRITGKWERNPDKWHSIVDLEENSYKNVSPEEAMESSLNLDPKIVNFCEKISRTCHEGQFTKEGTPYYTHPKAVAEKCNFPLTKSIAYLHDVIEDTDMDEYKLEAMSVPRSVIDRVLLLTHNENVKYMDYVKNISNDPVASEVKYCDLKHNTDLSRMNGKKAVSDEKWKNYQNSLKLLNDKYHFE